MSNKNKAIAGILGSVGAILASVFMIEGGYVDHPNDPGGATNYGVTEQVARNYGYKGSMETIPKETAKEIYIDEYIVKPKYHEVIKISEALGHKLVDTGINVGQSRATRWFQTAINALSKNGSDYPLIVADGKLGPATLSAYKALQQIRGPTKACELVIKLIDIQQGTHYLSLSIRDSFITGWVDKRIQNVPLTGC